MCDTDKIGVQKKEMDDSGLVFDLSAQDVSMSARVNLMDLSDDVLLYIMRFCAPRDLKALGFSSPRLASLVRERSLWRYVDARSESCSRARLKWFLDNALHADTHVILLTGYAKEAEGCMGLINVSRKEAEQEISAYSKKAAAAASAQAIHEIPVPQHMDRMERHPARFFISAQRTPLSRHRSFPSWPLEGEEARVGPQRCRGPQFSLSPMLLQQLAIKCPQLHTLGLDYCNIDCAYTCLGTFPKTLKKLSLQGTKCYNMTFNKSFLFKIQDYLPVLESLNVSECDWMDPATLLPLSKMAALEELIMQDCYKLAEFVAYASLTARYGFRVLKSLDLRGSPVGDSEVSALGWLPQLEKLWLSARRPKRTTPHAHYADDEYSQHETLHDWEVTDSDDSTSKSSPDTIGDVAQGMGNDIPSIPRSHPKGTKGFKDNKDDKDDKDKKDKKGKKGKKGKKHAKRKPDDGPGDDSDNNGAPSSKRQRTGVKISFENNTVTKRILPVVRNENGLFVFDESALPNNGNNNGNVNNNENNDAPNFEFNLINPLGSIDVGNVEIDFSVINVGNMGQRNANANNGNRDNPNNNRVNAHQEYRYRYKSNDNRGSSETVNNGGNDAECMVDCIKIDQLIDVSDTTGGRQNELIVIASSARPKSEPSTSKQRPDGTDDSKQSRKPAHVNPNAENASRRNVGREGNPNGGDVNGDGNLHGEDVEVINDDPQGSVDNDVPEPDDAEMCDGKMDGDKIDEPKPGPSNEQVNEGASTSKEGPSQAEDDEKYVLFRKNEDPVYVNCAPENVQRREPLPPVQYQIEPRHHVLYVGVGPQLNTYRFPRDSAELLRQLNFRPTHTDSSGLVTDFAIRRFGRADGEDINIIHIGPDGPMLVGQAPGSRADRSSLRFLSVTGYRHITDRSLLHLATAAPNLEFVDFSGTFVTQNGADQFKSLRPDCDVVFSQYYCKEEDE